MPIAGTVTAVNSELEEAPELVNQEPYGGGWMLMVKPDDISQFDQLKDKKAYLEALKG
jgi:glycine cleavage system H protein